MSIITITYDVLEALDNINFKKTLDLEKYL